MKGKQLKTTVLAKLAPDEHDRLIALEAAQSALPYDSDDFQMFDKARQVREALLQFQASMIEKYIVRNDPESDLEELFGDYGYDFDAAAGVITRVES